jgi:hypothetical protein
LDFSGFAPRAVVPMESGSRRSYCRPIWRRVVLDLAAAGDEAAHQILESETMDLARTVAGAISNGGLPTEGVPIALTGGLVLHNAPFRERLLANLPACGVMPGPVGLVDDPALGAVVLARKLLS